MTDSRADDAVGALIDEHVARGVFRAAALPTDKGVQSFRIVWFQDQAMTLSVDRRRAQVRLLDVLPTLESRSAIDRQLRAWLRERTAATVPEHRRVDPSLLQLKLTNRGGQMQLAMNSLNGDMLFATRKLLHLANELYLDFLSAPARYDWIIETFELDPDNPRWP